MNTLFARVGQDRVAYQVVGEGSPTLFFAGAAAPVDLLWDHPVSYYFHRHLASSGRLVVCDFRGAGSSDGYAPGTLVIETWMDDITAVLDAAGANAAVLIAYAEAAIETVMYAATHPERTSGLVLIHAFARQLRARDYPWGIPPEQLAAYIDRVRTLWGSAAMSALQAPSMENDRSFEGWLTKSMRLGMAPSVVARIIELNAPRDVRGVLPAVRVPTLILHRKDNPVVRVGHARYLADNIAGSQLIELAGQDHLYLAGDSDALLSAIEGFVAALGQNAPEDRVLATVLFTDIVESTATAHENGDAAWRRLLDTHDAAVAASVAAHRGRVVKSTGDGALALFEGPTRAIDAAQEIQLVLRDTGLRIRAGVHTGEIERRRGDVGGVGVHIAARVAALAGPDEVLVTQTVCDLVTGSQTQFSSRGARELKGIPGVWALYRVEPGANKG